MYFGIFHGGTYYDGTKQFLQLAHAAYPTKPIFDTEFGYWSSEDGSTQATQKTVFLQTYLAFTEVGARTSTGTINPNGFLMGMTWWCAFDWYTSQQTNGFQSMGVLHMNRLSTKQVTSVLSTFYKPYFDNLLLTTVHDGQVGNIPSKVQLLQNYPNPFNPSTSIRYALPHADHIRLKVFDVLGREVATLADGMQNAGFHEVLWNARGMSSGIYLCRLVSGTSSETKRLSLVK